MRAGDKVIYIARPSWGLGTIMYLETGGRLLVVFDNGVEDVFHPQELETAELKAA